MKDPKLKKALDYYQGHTAEFTRRQFLFNAGMTSIASYLTLSNLPQLFIDKAYAQATNGAANNLPFVSMECAGGINLGGNVIVGRDNSGTQEEWSTIDSYLYMGFTPDLHPSRTNMVDDTFGLKFHATSGILKGMKQVLNGKKVTVDGAEVLISDMVDGLFFAYRSTDDSGGNPINTSIPAVKAGASGRLVNLIGNSGSPNGGSSVTDTAVYDPLLRPPVVSGIESAKRLVSLGYLDGLVAQENREAQYSNFMERIARLSKKRLELLYNKKVTADTKVNIGNALDRSKEFFKQFNASELDANKDAAILNKVFHNNADPLFPGVTPARDRDQIGTIGYLLLDNNLVGASMLTVGGGDYHDGTAATGIKKDQELGMYIGELIYYAALKGKNIVIDLYTDGSAICNTSGVIDTSPTGQGRVIHHTDSPVQSGSIMMVYRHGKTRAADPIVKTIGAGTSKTTLRQIGYFLPGKGGGVDLSSNSMANNIVMPWRIKMLNYLALMEPTNSPNDVILKFEKIYGRGLLGTDAKDMIRFNYIG